MNPFEDCGCSLSWMIVVDCLITYNVQCYVACNRRKSSVMGCQRGQKVLPLTTIPRIIVHHDMRTTLIHLDILKHNRWTNTTLVIFIYFYLRLTKFKWFFFQYTTPHFNNSINWPLAHYLINFGDIVGLNVQLRPNYCFSNGSLLLSLLFYGHNLIKYFSLSCGPIALTYDGDDLSVERGPAISFLSDLTKSDWVRWGQSWKKSHWQYISELQTIISGKRLRLNRSEIRNIVLIVL